MVAGPTLFTCQRNEGIFLLEWLAYHKTIGFERFLVLSNDCFDGSDELLDILQSKGIVEHVVHTPRPDQQPQTAGAELIMERGLLADGEWAMWLDADEYLNLHLGDKRLPTLLNQIGDADGIYFFWRCFGDSGLTEWPGVHLTTKLDRAAGLFFSQNQQIKTLFRFTDGIVGLNAHRPIVTPEYRDRHIWLTPRGRPTSRRFYQDYRKNGMPNNKPSLLPNYRLGQVNHYAVRTPDIYPLRRMRGDGISLSNDRIRHDMQHYRRYNRNRVRDRSILALAGRTHELMQHWLNDPEIAEAHNACIVRTWELLGKANAVAEGGGVQSPCSNSS